MILRTLLNRVGAAAVVGLLALVAAPAQAAFTGLIDIRFKANRSLPGYSGPAVVGAAGDTWNSIYGDLGVSATASNVALVAADNSATSVTLAYDIGGAYTAGSFAPTLGDMADDYFYRHTTGGPTVTGAPDFEGLISGIQLQSIAPIVITPSGPAVPLPPALFAGLLAPALVWPARKRFMKK